MPKWILSELAPSIGGIVIMVFVNIITRPNCSLIFDCKNERDEKRRRLARKISYIGLFASTFTAIVVIINNVIAK